MAMRLFQPWALLFLLFLVGCQNVQGPAPTGTTATIISAPAPNGPRVGTITPAVSPAASPTAPPATFMPKVEVVAGGLEVPWALAFADRLPGGDGRPRTGSFLFFTERPGRLRLIANGRLLPDPVATPPVLATGEGGLTGLALDPNFADNGFLYVMYTFRAGDGPRNRVSRLTVRGEKGGDEVVLLDGIPGASIHDGGALAFGPDGKLYVGTGDASNGQNAQDRGSLGGKLLRLNPDGSIPADNPFPNSPVFTYGNRNPQGLAWQPGTGQLYEVEHGPSSIGPTGCCHDEVNRVTPGANYGWPDIVGKGGDHRFVDPVLETGNDTWAPSGAAFYDGSLLAPWRGDLFIGTLRGRHLHRVRFGGPNGDQVVADEVLFANQFGRLRAVKVGPEGALYLTTSNRDGRGIPSPQDDRILRVVPGP
ncbi:MAG: PQQ-dependent sugar dehydrogenase [Chloroflexota bacterium]